MVVKLIKPNRSYLLIIDGYLYTRVNEKNGQINEILNENLKTIEKGI